MSDNPPTRCSCLTARRIAALAVALIAATTATLAFVTCPAAAQTQRAERENTAKARAQNGLNLVGHGGPVKAVRLGAGGARALTGSFDYSMIYWDISGEAPKIISRFDEHDGAVNAVRFLPGGKRALSAGDDAVLRLWDLESGRLIHAFKGHTAKIVDIDLTPDGRLAATASWDTTVRFWNLETLEPGHVLEGHGGPVNAVAFTASDNEITGFYSASQDSTIRHWDIATGEARRVVYRHGWGINCLKALPDGKLIFGSLNGAAGVIDPQSGEQVTVLNPHEGPVLAISVSPEHGLVATGGGDGAVNIWSSREWVIKEQHRNPYGPVWAIAFTQDASKLYYAGLDDFVTLWQVSPRQPFEEVQGKFPRRFQARDDMSLGELQFARKCSICHTITPDGANRAGPTLFGVFGRKAGAVQGYAYSPALLNSDIIWNEKTIGELFDHGPQHVTPGSKMPLQQIEDDTKRNALIAYLKAATTGENENEGARDGAAKSRE